MGCFGTTLSLLVVGLSNSFWMALLGGILGGALNGNIGVIQTMVGELVTNPKHERMYQSGRPLHRRLTSNSQSIRDHALCVVYRYDTRTIDRRLLC